MSEDKRAKILNKVQLLLNKAESTEFGDEQDALLAKVDELMTEYAIADWEVAQRGGEKAEPTMSEFLVSEAHSDIWYDLASLAGDCARFFDCRTVFPGLQGKGKWAVTCKIVGYPENNRNAEFLFQSLRLQMMQHLTPRWQPYDPIEVNVRLCKEAGMKWTDIWDMAYKAGDRQADTSELSRSRLISWQKKYKTYCENNGYEVVSVNPKNYKINYTTGFVTTVAGRMFEIKHASKMARAATEEGASTSLVLFDRTKMVDEAYSTYFPKVGRGVSRGDIKHNSAARQSGRNAANSADLGTSNSRMSGSRKELS